jgi:hypothetical protein
MDQYEDDEQRVASLFFKESPYLGLEELMLARLQYMLDAMPHIRQPEGVFLMVRIKSLSFFFF